MIKNLKKIACILTISALSISGAKATEECFENTSRAIFKFNMAFDDIVLEPIAKGYNKLRTSQNQTHQQWPTFYPAQPEN